MAPWNGPNYSFQCPVDRLATCSCDRPHDSSCLDLAMPRRQILTFFASHSCSGTPCSDMDLVRNCKLRELSVIGPFIWGHSRPLCHALSLSSSLSWTSMRRRRATVATPGEWQCKTGCVRRLTVANGPNIFQMLLVLSAFSRL